MGVLLQGRYRAIDYANTERSTGLDFEEGGNFWDSIVNVKVVANLFFYVYSHFFFFSSFVIRMIYDHGSLSNWVLTPFPPCADH